MAVKPDRPLVWLHGEIKTPPFSPEGRIEAGTLLRRLQRGEHHDAVVIAEVFSKKTPATPPNVIDTCKKRLQQYDEAAKEHDS